jgi:hypothetical protein
MSVRRHVCTLGGLEDSLRNAAFILCAGGVAHTGEMALQVTGLGGLASARRWAACGGAEALLRSIRTSLLWAAGRKTGRGPICRVTSHLGRGVEELLARESVNRHCAPLGLRLIAIDPASELARRTGGSACTVADPEGVLRGSKRVAAEEATAPGTRIGLADGRLLVAVDAAAAHRQGGEHEGGREPSRGEHPPTLPAHRPSFPVRTHGRTGFNAGRSGLIVPSTPGEAHHVRATSLRHRLGPEFPAAPVLGSVLLDGTHRARDLKRLRQDSNLLPPASTSPGHSAPLVSRGVGRCGSSRRTSSG